MNDLPERLLLTEEVATVFGVRMETITRWAKAGKLPAGRTPGGQWRFPEGAVRALLAKQEGVQP